MDAYYKHLVMEDGITVDEYKLRKKYEFRKVIDHLFRDFLKHFKVTKISFDDSEEIHEKLDEYFYNLLKLLELTSFRAQFCLCTHTVSDRLSAYIEFAAEDKEFEKVFYEKDFLKLL
jgi:hypothetical protein